MASVPAYRRYVIAWQITLLPLDYVPAFPRPCDFSKRSALAHLPFVGRRSYIASITHAAFALLLMIGVLICVLVALVRQCMSNGDDCNLQNLAGYRSLRCTDIRVRALVCASSGRSRGSSLRPVLMFVSKHTFSERRRVTVVIIVVFVVGVAVADAVAVGFGCLVFYVFLCSL